ncbi:MAG: Clp1/GlmU family protein [Nitrososphaerales archaeon]|nr:Clp1/GlmU family protein [Nitrososphaerales archaeon]
MLSKLITLMKDEVLLVKGPATVRVKSGGASVLGATLKIDHEVLVRKNKVLPFESNGESSFIVTLGDDGDYSVECGDVGTRIWKDVVDKVFKNDLPKRLILIGKTDSGKSTLATYLTNIAVSKGLKVGIVDGDVGQNDLGPPGSVGVKVVEDSIFDLRDLSAERLNFIGVTSPRYKFVENSLMSAIRDLVESVSKTVDLCIINTDGYVSEGGVNYKLNLIDNVRPDLIIYLKSPEGESELYTKIVERLGADRLVVAERSKRFVKNRVERIERRVRQYHRFLKDGRRIKVNLKSLKLIFLGNMYSMNANQVKFESSEAFETWKRVGGDGSLIISQGINEGVIKVYNDCKFVFINQSSLQGMFVALGVDDCVKGFGIIQRVFPTFDTYILTPMKERFDSVFLSLISLAPNMTEESTIPLVFG